MKLSIAEGLYLIALDDEEGRLLSAAEKTIVDGVLSAIILELYIQKKIDLNGGVITVNTTEGTGNGILDDVLRRLNNGNTIIETVASLKDKYKDIKVSLDELLVHRGILKREETKLLWIPLSERMDNANYAFEKEIRNILQAMVFKNAKPTPSFVVLMSLIYDCGILEEVFRDKDDYIDAVKVAKDVVNSPVINSELSTALKELKKYFSK
jgi:hypothetical protein